MPVKPWFKRRRPRVFLVLVVLIIAALIYLAVVAIDRPPEVDDMSALDIQRIDHGNGTYSYGSNWLRKSESGLWELYLEGSPFERGVAFGQLTRELLYYQETTFFNQIREIIPSDRYLKVLKYFIAFFNRNLDNCISDEYKKEIYGTSLACDPSYDFIGSGYQRQLNYHAAHDIGHALQGMNLVACTSFSAWDNKSKDSSLLIGRNFDFYMGDEFAVNKIVCFVKPDSGYRFMMITWADLIGVVSGMNEKGLTVTLNAAKSKIPWQAATPVTLLAREILQYASDIDEAYEIARKRDLFVSESIMIGSANDNTTAIIEKSPHKTALYNPGGNLIVCSNHFQSEEFADDPRNLENIKESDSFDRMKRVNELLSRSEKIDVGIAASILRDQKVLNDVDAGMGNELAINQMIAHHSVIFKPDSLLVWISTAPWQLGKFVAYDLNEIFNLPAQLPDREIQLVSRTIPADSFLYNNEYTQFMRYRELSRELRLLKNVQKPLPEGFAEEYIQTNPLLYLTYSNLGDYYYETGDMETAVKYYKGALECRLPGLEEKVHLEKKITKISKKTDNGSSRN